MKRNSQLDFIRAFLIFLVVANHLRAFLFVDINHLNSNLSEKFFYFFTGFGHLAVIFFLILSGFSIYQKYGKIEFNTIKFAGLFIVKRAIRLWVVLIPALLVTFVFDNVGMYWGNDCIYHNGYDFNGMIKRDLSETLAISNFLGTFFFLNGLTSIHVFGSNTPLWYLAVQFWIYVLYAFLKYIKRYKFRNLIYIVVALIITCCILKGFKFFFYFSIWALGYLISNYRNEIGNFKGKFGFSLLILLFFAMLICRLLKSTDLVDFVFGLLASWFTLLIVDKSFYLKKEKIITLFASFSFTLYATHYPLFVCFVSFYTHFPPLLNWKNSSLMIYTSLLIVVYIVAYIVYLLFEKNTPSITKKIHL